MTPLQEIRLNVKTLSARATFLRQEEIRALRIARRLRGKQGQEVKRAQVYDSHETLHNSRVGSNRAALRHLHITRALVKDMALYRLEDPMHTRSPVDWDRVVDNLIMFRSLGRNEARAVVDSYIERSYEAWEQVLLAREEHAKEMVEKHGAVVSENSRPAEVAAE